MAFAVPGSTADSLYQGSLRTKKALFICVQDRYQRDLRNIQSFSQKVDPDQHIKHIQAHIADDLRTFQSVNVRMKIPDTDSQIFHIIGKVLCHTFGQSRDQDFVFLLDLFIYFCYKIIDLSFDRTHLYLRIKKSGRADDLLCPEKFMVKLIFSRCCRYEHHLVQLGLKFIKA